MFVRTQQAEPHDLTRVYMCVCVCVFLEAYIFGLQRQIKMRIHMYLVDRDDGKNSIS
jgi:uncharacterized protein YlaN (UPF0358 family)